MKILAIETTAVTGSVALAEDDRLLGSLSLPTEQRSAESLIPAIEELLRGCSVPMRQIDRVAAAIGPGSFTGLRIGITCANLLAWGIQAQTVGIETLDAMAFSISRDFSHRFQTLPLLAGRKSFVLSAAFDAQRREVVERKFLISAQSATPLGDRYQLIPIEEWLASDLFFTPEDSEPFPLLFASPILSRWRKKVSEQTAASFVPEEYFAPTASSIALMARNAPVSDPPYTLRPIYSRLAAAEEKLLEKRD